MADEQADSDDADNEADDEMSRREKMLQSHAVQLAEHFDSVQIVATSRRSDGQTILTHFGKGNWYAREGSVREWLRVQDERTREQVRAENDD